MVKEIVSLLDPITRRRIKVATRGVNCTHAQCFDRDTFLTENLTCNEERKKKEKEERRNLLLLVCFDRSGFLLGRKK
jgi:hypothetical protein